jgi:hypothetical protein
MYKILHNSVCEAKFYIIFGQEISVNVLRVAEVAVVYSRRQFGRGFVLDPNRLTAVI